MAVKEAAPPVQPSVARRRGPYLLAELLGGVGFGALNRAGSTRKVIADRGRCVDLDARNWVVEILAAILGLDRSPIPLRGDGGDVEGIEFVIRSQAIDHDLVRIGLGDIERLIMC